MIGDDERELLREKQYLAGEREDEQNRVLLAATYGDDEPGDEDEDDEEWPDDPPDDFYDEQVPDEVTAESEPEPVPDLPSVEAVDVVRGAVTAALNEKEVIVPAGAHAKRRKARSKAKSKTVRKGVNRKKSKTTKKH